MSSTIGRMRAANAASCKPKPWRDLEAERVTYPGCLLRRSVLCASSLLASGWLDDPRFAHRHLDSFLQSPLMHRVAPPLPCPRVPRAGRSREDGLLSPLRRRRWILDRQGVRELNPPAQSPPADLRSLPRQGPRGLAQDFSPGQGRPPRSSESRRVAGNSEKFRLRPYGTARIEA